ncbi:MAG TPA: hypothetical protein VGO03_01360 [Acidimicrobiia bacterium]|jgi:hypothetical protein
MIEADRNGLGIDEHFLMKYRSLLDVEEAAFDELEHAYEDGDRAHFEDDFRTWCEAVRRRANYLERCVGPATMITVSTTTTTAVITA